MPTAIENEPWTRTDLNINVVGGDSVTKDTPILCKNEKNIFLVINLNSKNSIKNNGTY